MSKTSGLSFYLPLGSRYIQPYEDFRNLRVHQSCRSYNEDDRSRGSKLGSPFHGYMYKDVLRTVGSEIDGSCQSGSSGQDQRWSCVTLLTATPRQSAAASYETFPQSNTTHNHMIIMLSKDGENSSHGSWKLPIPRPSSYPRFWPKYILLGTIYPQ